MTRLYSENVGRAVAFAAEAHASQARKGRNEPYLSHVLAVAGLVAHYGGDEEQIIAGALHDAVEDQGGVEMAERIRDMFGDRVATIVLACSDATPAPGEDKGPWRPRKEAYLAGLAGPDESGARLVEVCDKLANLRDLVEDAEAEGASALDRFNGGREGTLWYYEELGRILLPAVPRAQREYTLLLDRLRTATT